MRGTLECRIAHASRRARPHVGRELDGFFAGRGVCFEGAVAEDLELQLPPGRNALSHTPHVDSLSLQSKGLGRFGEATEVVYYSGIFHSSCPSIPKSGQSVNDHGLMGIDKTPIAVSICVD